MNIKCYFNYNIHKYVAIIHIDNIVIIGHGNSELIAIEAAERNYCRSTLP